MRQTSTLASKLLLEKKTTADSCMNVNETTNLKEELKAHERVTCIIVTEINKCFIIDFYRIVKLILLIDLFSL